MYQSSHEDSCRQMASAEVVQKIQRACEFDKISLGPSAQYHTRYWQIGRTGLRDSVDQHIKSGCKIYRKYVDGVLLEKNFEANLTIYEGKEVYVEMVMTEGILVVLNAHEHKFSVSQRLPQ